MSSAVVNPWFANLGRRDVPLRWFLGGGNRWLDGQDGRSTNALPPAGSRSRPVSPPISARREPRADIRPPDGVYNGTAPNPGGGLPYTQVDPITGGVRRHKFPPLTHAGLSGSPSARSQTCKSCSAIGRDINSAKVPGKVSPRSLFHTDGGPTAGCVAIDDATLVQIVAAWCGDRDRWVNLGPDCELCDGFSACCVVRFTSASIGQRGPA